MTAWLVTWLWQGLVLSLGATVMLKGARRLNAATRHLTWYGVLLALGWLGWSTLPFGGLTPVPVPGSDPIYVPEPVLYVPSAPDTILSVLLGMWAAIVLINLVRLVPGLHAVYALRDRCRPMPPHVEPGLPLWLEARARGRRADLMICDAVPGATVLGFQRPCVAVPSSLVEALTPEELDQVVLHEYAHVQRRDDWLRLAEQLILSVMCVHPAAWFIARQLNREREMACDEWVVHRTGLPKAYARCLAHAAELRNRIRGRAALIPALLGGRHELVRRVDRLLATDGKNRGRVSVMHAAAAVCVMTIASGILQGVRAAEIASIVFPIERVQLVRSLRGEPLRRVQGMQRMQQVQGVRKVRGLHEVRQVQTEQQLSAGDPVESALSAPMIGAMLESRSFAAIASGEPAPIARAATVAPITPGGVSVPAARVNDWRALATPGVEIAATAKKTSVGIAAAFGRAGRSLSRSF